MSTTEQELLEFLEAQLDAPTGDGLPVMPPTESAVAAMIEAAALPADEVLGVFAPRDTEVTVQQVAVNAVMAGCRPDYAPVLVAATRALVAEAFDLVGVANSTKGSAPLLIVNGPVRERIGINCRGNVFGPSFRANATIGRAIRLMILNVGGAVPNELDRGTLGHSGRFSYCIGEDEEDSPWTPLHVERGLEHGDSAVTVFGGEGMRLVNNHYNTADAVLAAVADTLATTGIYNEHNITGRSPHLVVFAKEHRDLLDADGWTKQLIREYVAEQAVIDEARLAKAGSAVDGPVAVVEAPDDLLVVAAGGHAGRFAGVVAGWSWQSRPVTVRVGGRCV